MTGREAMPGNRNMPPNPGIGKNLELAVDIALDDIAQWISTGR